MEVASLGLESKWTEVSSDGGSCFFLADVIVYDPASEKHLVRTAISRKFVTLEGPLDSESVACTVLNGRLNAGLHGHHVTVSSGHLLSHGLPSTDGMSNAIELCSGIGSLGEGLEHNGFVIRVRNELKQAYVKLMNQQGFAATVVGDVGASDTIATIHSMHKDASLHAAGFPCQPFSRLGDRRQSKDERGKVLAAILRTSFLLRAHSILLECVTQARDDPYIKQLLYRWCRVTGFNARECQLELHTIWPSRRTRWWVLLSFGGSKPPTLMPLPVIEPSPCVADVLPFFPEWPKFQKDQLMLDLHELRTHDRLGGLPASIVNMEAPLRTALHSLGNQLQACPCGCREWPMHIDRLERQGIHSILVPCNETLQAGREKLQAMRFIHPWELALLLGLKPNKQWLPLLRLSLSGIGQVASPIQSGWVISQYNWANADHTMNAISTPEHMLWMQLDSLFAERNAAYPMMQYCPKTQHFQKCLRDQLAGGSQSRQVPRVLSTAEDIETSIAEPEDLDLTPRKSPGELEILEHEEKTPKKHELPFETDELNNEPVEHDPYEIASLDEEETKLGWKLFETVCPTVGEPDRPELGTKPSTKAGISHADAFVDASENVHSSRVISDNEAKHPFDAIMPHAVAIDEASTTAAAPGLVSENAKEIWQQTGAIPGFQWHQLHSMPSPTATWDADAEVRKHKSIDFWQKEPKATPPDDSIAATAIDPETPRVLNPGVPVDNRDMAQMTRRVRINISHPETGVFVTYEVKHGTTIEQIIAAENQFQLTTNWDHAVTPLGLPHHPSLILHEEMWIHLRASHTMMPTAGVTRIQQMREQGTWVAADEMAFYLEEHPFKQQASNHGTLAFESNTPATVICEQLSQHIGAMIEGATGGLTQFTAVLANNHWVPFVIQFQDGVPTAYTTQEGVDLMILVDATEEYEIPDELNYVVMEMPTVFPGDCGFQTKVWLLNTVGRLTDDSWVAFAPLNVGQAEQWRLQFHAYLMESGRGQARFQTIITGGALGSDTVTSQLEELLHDHGVPRHETATRATDVINQLGRHAVSQCLRSNRAWKDLKAKANVHVPKLQLILPGELAEQVKKRAIANKPIQSKRKQQKNTEKKVPIRLQPEDIQIPCGIFQQAPDIPVPQIQLNQIGADAQGVITVSSQDALPYLTMGRTVSSKGLALLVLDHQNIQLQSHGSLTRFPARCTTTSEPMLVSAKLIQLGQADITRSQPQQTMKLEDANTFVLRVVAHRDELEHDWDSFVMHPVRTILNDLALVPKDKNEDSPVVDVWDRQWLSAKLARVPPAQATMYIVNIRLTNLAMQHLLTQSGSKGLYLEPRDETGRLHHDGFRVIWLPGLGRAAAQAAIQTSPHWASLARQGMRFGLRTQTQHAETTHNLHKPQVPFLSSAQVKSYTVGPLPFNCTRATLSKLFEQWQWKARATQPKGRARDGTGVVWQVLAESAPASEVYQMEHGDVIITIDEPKRSMLDAAQPSNLLASAKTVAALREKPLHMGMQADKDPWEDADPWQHHRTKQVKTSPPEVSPQQLKAIEDSLRTSIMTNMPKENDVPMQSEQDERITAMEARILRVEQGLQQQSQVQQQQHVETQQNIAAVQQKVEAEHKNMHQVLDNRFAEQLSQIERLLSMKQRVGE